MPCVHTKLVCERVLAAYTIFFEQYSKCVHTSAHPKPHRRQSTTRTEFASSRGPTVRYQHSDSGDGLAALQEGGTRCRPSFPPWRSMRSPPRALATGPHHTCHSKVSLTCSIASIKMACHRCSISPSSGRGREASSRRPAEHSGSWI